MDGNSSMFWFNDEPVWLSMENIGKPRTYLPRTRKSLDRREFAARATMHGNRSKYSLKMLQTAWYMYCFLESQHPLGIAEDYAVKMLQALEEAASCCYSARTDVTLRRSSKKRGVTGAVRDIRRSGKYGGRSDKHGGRSDKHGGRFGKHGGRSGKFRPFAKVYHQ
jgi:hypothetical protein